MGKRIKARKSGSSLIITMPVDIAELMGIKEGTELEIIPFRKLDCAPQSGQQVKLWFTVREIYGISIIRELESGKNLAQLSRENNLHPTMISRWKFEYRKNPESAFKGNGNTYKETARIQELERLVGKLYAENDLLKKALSILEKRAQEEKEMLKMERNS